MKPKILLVDDHKGLRQLVRDWLTTEFPQCHVFEASSGENALELARREFPDILVMDIELPGIDGIETIRQIKQFLPAGCKPANRNEKGSKWK
jgi:CheY-like chemotaxis protein